MTFDEQTVLIGDRVRFTRNAGKGEGRVVERLGYAGVVVRDDQGGDWRVAYRSLTEIVSYKLTTAQREALLALQAAGATGETLDAIDIKGSHLRNALAVRTLHERGYKISNATLGALARRGLVEAVEVGINLTWGQYSTWGLSAEGRQVASGLVAGPQPA